jgi:hypothetical protein
MEFVAMLRFFLRSTLVAVLAWAATGCGSKKSVYPVQGKIVDAEGKPVSGATVIFCPAENVYDNANKPAGLSDQHGNFTLTTYAQNDGAPAGEYVVAVEWRTGPKNPDKPRQAPPDRLGGKFSDPKKSPLRATIIKGKKDVEIRLP